MQDFADSLPLSGVTQSLVVFSQAPALLESDSSLDPKALVTFISVRAQLSVRVRGSENLLACAA